MERHNVLPFSGQNLQGNQDPPLLMDSKDWNAMAFELKMICVTITVILDANNIPSPKELLREGRILPMPCLTAQFS